MRRLLLPAAVRAASLLLLLGAVSPALAQSLTTAIGYCFSASPAGGQGQLGCATAESSLAVSGVRVNGTTVGLELGVGFAAGDAGSAAPVGSQAEAGTARLGLDLSANETFGPLGNVVFEFAGDLRSDGLAQAQVGVRGVIGPVAARLSLGAHGAPPAAFDSLSLAGQEIPSYGVPGFSSSYRLGLTGRPSRNLILEAEPELFLTGQGAAGRFTTRVRLLRLLGDNELRLLLGAAATPGFAAAHWSLGAGVWFPRGRAPDMGFTLSVGVAQGRVSPGATVELSENLAGGAHLSLNAALEPYRLDVHPGRVRAGLELPVAGGTVSFEAVAAFLDSVRPTAVALRTSYSRAVTLPGAR